MPQQPGSLSLKGLTRGGEGVVSRGSLEEGQLALTQASMGDLSSPGLSGMADYALSFQPWR